MALEIIGAGFGRTGTLSLQTALNQLGLPCYHMLEVLENKANKGHLDFWHRVAQTQSGHQHGWEQVFANYRATVDNPACCVWPELIEAYPEAKVILTLHPRGPEAWFESTYETIYFTERLWQWKVLEWLTPFGRKMGQMCRRLVWERSLKGTMSDKSQAVARYKAYEAELRAAMPADRLLVYSVDQGWKPLCDFLNMPMPDTPFPRVNDRTQAKAKIRGIIVGAYAIVAVAVLTVCGLLALLIWLLA